MGDIFATAQERYDADIKRAIGHYGLSRGAPVPWHMLSSEEQASYVRDAVASDLAALRAELEAVAASLKNVRPQLTFLDDKIVSGAIDRIRAVASHL